MRYIIGIDLGTTNNAVAYADCQSPTVTVQQFRILQLIAAGQVDDLPTLAACCYLSADDEWQKGSTQLPWKTYTSDFVGNGAKVEGAKIPTRLIQSAKSWLCHSGANRHEKILPFESASEDRRISPVEASSRYLAHIRDAWNHQVAKGDVEQEFTQQEIVLTIPASFDEIARGLTVEAAKQAGITHLTLLEEPQAAFYAWLARNERTWQKQLPAGSCVLVCDIGGGTSDFSLIDVTETEGISQLQRMSVGDHLLLGGDNMDAAIAHYIEERLFDQEPTQQQWLMVKHQARAAKEALLQDKDPPHQYQIILQGEGASVVKGSRTVMLKREELEEILSKGFFGQYDWSDALQLSRGSGMRAMGLPYEQEPSIIKHLAHFLQSNADANGRIRQPDYVLFNGGAMKPKLFQNLIVDSLIRWFPNKNPKILASENLDLAVARGAAYYGKVRKGMGVRVGGGSARGYYLGINVEQSDGSIIKKALTLLPRGAEEGARFEPEHTFMLQPNSAATFELFSSHVRLSDSSGNIIDMDDTELQPLPPIHTILRFGKKLSADSSTQRIPVRIGIHLNAVGTLELWLHSQQTEHKWNLEFQIRTASGHDSISNGIKGIDEQIESSFIEKASGYLQQFFSPNPPTKLSRLMETLESSLEKPRQEWSLSTLRILWQALPKSKMERHVSLEAHSRWWNLAGFLMRPGFGYALDDFRMKELWLIILSEINHSSDQACLIQKAICYRRIAAGLNKGQQVQIAHVLLPLLLDKKSGKILVKGKAELYQYSELIRAVASLELLDLSLKEKIGNALVDRIAQGGANNADFWALGRIGARMLFHGAASNVIPKDICTKWVERLLELPIHDNPHAPLLFALLAHKTDKREINLSAATIKSILKFYPSAHLEDALSKSETSKGYQEQMFGEQLPLGLLLKNEHIHAS